MRRLKLMEVGYNLIERKLIGKEYEEIKDKMSIVEFLRRLRRNRTPNLKISVTGFEEALLSGTKTATYIRRILKTSTSRLRNHIIQIPINGELILNRQPKIRYRGREIPLTPIFGNRIRPKTIGYYHSPPNI